MKLSSLLSPHAVRVINSISSKKRLMRELAEVAHQTYDTDVGQAVDALLERETLGPTGVGHGVALPHARIEGVTEVSAVFLRLEKPLEFDAVDRQPVDLVMCLFAPVDSGVSHLKALALVSRTLRDADICTKLRANTEPATLHTILTEMSRDQAA